MQPVPRITKIQTKTGKRFEVFYKKDKRYFKKRFKKNKEAEEFMSKLNTTPTVAFNPYSGKPENNIEFNLTIDRASLLTRILIEKVRMSSVNEFSEDSFLEVRRLYKEIEKQYDQGMAEI